MKIFILIGSLFITACSSTSYLIYDKENELRKNQEFEQQVVVKEVPPVDEPVVEPESVIQDVLKPLTPVKSENKSTPPLLQAKKEILSSKPTDKTKGLGVVTRSTPSKQKKNKKDKDIVIQKPLVRQPLLEDSVGFDGQRRPINDPFRVGEKVVHSVRYFAAEAGRLNLEVKPFVEVNGKKSYRLLVGLKTSSLFSKFYSVDDSVETFLDYENMIPHVFKLSVRETGKLAQSHAYFDHQNLKAHFWEKKYTEKNGQEENKKEWDLQEYSQNAFSGIFYMRIFDWKVGKENSFRVSDDGKNVVFKAKALALEKLSTEAGEFDAIKIKADILSRGALTQSGNIYFWLSNDSRKLVLKIEAEIKIGKLVSEVVEINYGKE